MIILGRGAFGIFFGCLFSLLTSCYSWAQNYPNKPVTIIVGFGAGDNVDVQIRALATKVSKLLGQPFTIVNKPGAAGVVALSTLVKENPDGYQLGAVIDTALDKMPAFRKLSYKLDDFVPILQFASSTSGVVVKADSPWKSFADFIDYSKQNPGKVTYTTTGAGTSMHVGFEYIAKQTHIQWVHVPYPAAQQGLTSLMGGFVTAAVGSTQWAPQVRAGSLRLLATLGEKRMKAFPDVPTLRELGYNYSADAINILIAPKGVPEEVVKKLNGAFRTAMDDPDYIRLLSNLYTQPSYRSSDELKVYMSDQLNSFTQLVKELGIPSELETK